MTEENYRVIEYDKTLAFLSQSRMLKAEAAPCGVRLVGECEAYRAVITLNDVFIGADCIYPEKVEYSDGGVIFTYRTGEESFSAVVRGAEGRVLLYDLRPEDTDDPFDIVLGCLSAAEEVSRLFGEDMLTAEEHEAAGAAAALELLGAPELIRYTEDAALESAGEYLRGINDPLGSFVFDYIRAKREGGELRALSRLVGEAKKSGLKKALAEKYLPICNMANEGRVKNPFVNRVKYEKISAAANRLSHEYGFDGRFPHFVKGEKYMNFSLGACAPYGEEREYHYDLALAFGVGGKKPKKYYSALFITDRIVFNIMKNCETEEETEKAVGAVFSAVDRITDGKEAEGDFYALTDPSQYDRSWSAQLTVIGGVVAAAGFLMSVLQLILGEAMSPFDYVACTALAVAFAALAGAVWYFGVFLKKHPKMLFKVKNKDR